MIEKVDRGLEKVIRVGLYLSGTAVLLMMLLTVVDVLLKWLFTSTLTGTPLFIENYLMPLAFFLGLPYAFSSKIFPRLDFFIDKFTSVKNKYWVMATVLFIEFLFCVLIAFFGILMTLHGINTNITFLAGIASYPLYPFFILITIGFGFLSIKMLLVIIKMVQSKGRNSFFTEVSDG